MKKRIVVPLFLFFISIGAQAQLALETFESGIPSSWPSFRNNVGTLNWGISSDSYRGTSAAFLNPSAENIGAGNTAQYFLATQFLMPENGEIRFYSKKATNANNGAIYQIRLSTASLTDPAGYTVILKSWTEADLNIGSQTAYEEKIVAIPSNIQVGLNVNIAFVVVNTQTGATPSGDAWFIDNVRVIESCQKVNQTDFSASNITVSGANLSWTHPTATDFQIQVVTQGTAPGATGTNVQNSYPAGSLDADTAYDVYIKTVCDADTASEWAGPFPFRTKKFGLSCNSPIVIPFSTTATYALSTNLNLFGDNPVSYTTPGTSCLPSTVTENYLNGAKAFFSYTPTQSGLINIKQMTLDSGPGCFGNPQSGVFVYENCANVGVSCIAGLNTTAVNAPKYISNLYVEAGHTYIIVISTIFDDPDASICFNFELTFSTCAPPATFTLSNLTTDSVTVSWDNVANLASSWEYAVQPANAGVPTGTLTATNTNVGNVINSGLAAGGSYDLYVRSVCGGVPGNWSIPYRFATQCIFNTPYSDSFDGITSNPVPCWTPVDINNDGLKWGAGYENIGIRPGNNQTNNNDMIVSPIINLGTTPKRLKFKYSSQGGPVRFSVVLSTTGIAPADFTTVLFPSQLIDTEGDELNKIINIPTSITGNVNFAFYIQPEAGETAYVFNIDDVVVEDKPACPDPLALAANNITTSQAELSWTAGDIETQWQIVVQPKNTGIPTGSGTLINTPQFTADQLTHATQYEYYVRAYCSSTQQSNWVGPFYFTTLCAVFETPFYESFNDSDVNNHRSCWSITDANSDGATWRLDNTWAAIQGNAFWGTPDYDDWLISPAINVVGTKALKFKYRAALSPFFPNPRFGVEVLMSTTDTNPASFSVVMPLMNFTNTDFIEKTIYINANGPVYIAFRVPPSFSIVGGTSVLNLDDVKIEDAPACPAPSELKAANITQNSAVLSWTKGYQETQWQVVVQDAGSGIPTGNGQLTSNNTAYAAGPLQPNTQYEYYVRAYCSTSEQSTWVGPFRFTTLCNAFTTPFVETFNPGSVSEECWRVVNGNSDTFSWNLNNTLNPYEGEHAAMIFTGSNGNNDDWLISPTVTVRPGQRLRYYYRVLWGGDFREDLEVKLSTNGIDPSQFSTMLYEIEYEDEPPLNNPEWKEKVINLPAGVTGDINIAWHIPQKTPNPWNFRGQLLVIDKVVIEDIPTCPVPNNLVVSDIIDTGAKISWDANGTETSWDVYVQPAELPAPVGDGDAQYLHNTTTNPYTVTGLIPAVRYEYYVRAVCGASQDSEWVGPFEFVTRCSFENLCEYTITLSSGNSGTPPGGINLVQNGVIVQNMEFPSGPWNEIPAPVDFTVFLCTGVEFSLVNGGGGRDSQFTEARIQIKDASGNEVWIGTIGQDYSRIYTGVAICGPVSCPQPTNLAVSPTGVLSWTAGGSETQWEVFVQPMENNTLPQSGTLVTTASYTPQASDFADLNAGTYEFFVRAVCGTNDKSYWSGPRKFVRNDDASKAVVIPVNAGANCEQAATKASFIGATASTEAMACTGVNNGDIWFEFVASSKVHVLELGNFSGKGTYQQGYTPDLVAPAITLTLYKVNGSSLEQLACTYNNAIVMSYMAEVEPGATYKVRMTMNDSAPNICTFDICITTPQDLCKLDIVNGSFERPEADFGMGNFYPQNIVPGWRTNAIEDTTSSLYNLFFFGNATGIDGYMPYEGGQVIQVLSPDSGSTTPDNVRGTYQDLDSSEITQFKYSYAHATRGGNESLELFAGPPSGPFVLLEDHPGSLTWNFYEGTYNVPAGQTVTRFVFRSKDNAIGNMLDAVSIIANVDIQTAPRTLQCQERSITVAAEGVGTWVADENNPAQTVIENPNNKSTAISGFGTSGNYIFHWKTRYCDKTIIFVYNGLDDAPTVVTPVEYCRGAVAQPLTATPTGSNSLKWYTQETGGTGTTTAPTPVTTTVGSTTYYVSNVDVNGCEGPRTAITVTINERAQAEVGFQYNGTNYCKLGANPVITKNPGFTTGGTFEATPNGLGINTTTGEINLSTSAAGTYAVKYSIGAVGCTDGGSHTVSITISAGTTPTVGFTYDTPVCQNDANLLPNLAAGFTSGGRFSAPAGVAINTATGEISVSQSTPGTYQIAYEIDGNAATCSLGGNGSFTITISAGLQASIAKECSNQTLWLKATPSDAASYEWKDGSGATVGSQADLNVEEYLSQHPGTTMPTTFTVTVGSGACSTTASFTVEGSSCRLIPRGISPNGDSLNDSFDLSGMGVRHLSIFNRYGTEVYKFKGSYSNEWHGQDRDGKDLPDATYFYSISKQDGTTVTGWVYINRQY